MYANVRDQALHPSQNNIVVLLDLDSCGNFALGTLYSYLVRKGNLQALLIAGILHNR